MKAEVKDLSGLIRGSAIIPNGWGGVAVVNDDNMTYVVWNEISREALVADPMIDDWETLIEITQGRLKNFRFIAVIDTHTHADHISCAANVARALQTPLIQHLSSPSQRVHLRVSLDTELSAVAAPLKLLMTPGHTADCITPIWGPFLFGGDTLLFEDTGRDDLPGGNALAHWESIQKIKTHAEPEMVLLPGHDAEGGRVSSWKTQLETSASLTQDCAAFVKEAEAYVGPAPKLLKESLFENFK